MLLSLFFGGNVAICEFIQKEGFVKARTNGSPKGKKKMRERSLQFLNVCRRFLKKKNNNKFNRHDKNCITNIIIREHPLLYVISQSR